MAKPVVTEEIYSLKDVDGGVNPSSINFKCVTMESDKYVCVRDQVGDQNSIVIVDLSTSPKSNSRHKIAADSAIMNPTSKVLALKDAQGNLQIFNLDLKVKMKSFAMRGETVAYWRWISSSTIALVTGSAVFHWSMEGQAEPKKIFDRKEELANCQILSYRVDESENWLLLVGVEKQPDSTLRGVTQLYCVEKNASRTIDGHAGCFVNLKPPGAEDQTPCTIMCVASNSAQGGKLLVMEVPVGAKQTTTIERKLTPIGFTSPQDFPVAMQASSKHGLLYLITRSGFLYLFDILTSTLLYSEAITQDPIFVTAPEERTHGLSGVNVKGQVLSVYVNEDVLVKYIQTTLGNADLALRIATTAGLGGADDLFVTKFNALLAQMDVAGAVKLAAEAPRDILRTPETIQRLGAISLPGQQPPLSLYFKSLIARDRLNKFEACELAKIVLAKGAQGAVYLKELIEVQDKLDTSEQLGDIVQPHDADLALKIYFKGNAHEKVLVVLLQRGDFQKVVQYCARVGHKPNWFQLLNNVINLGNVDAAVNFATLLHTTFAGTENALNPNQVVDMFVQRNQIKQVTAYLLDILKDNKEEDGPLQTRLLEINLMYSPPQVADSILNQENMFTHYDVAKIAQLCEKAQLYQRALENYNRLRREPGGETRLRDIKRVIINTHALNPTWLVDYFGDLTKEDCLECIQELMSTNPRQNFKVCVQVATKYNEQVGSQALIDLFLHLNSFEALYYYLGSIVNYSKDPEVHFNYIMAATKVGQFAEVERVTRESSYYDAEKTKQFLKESHLQDLWPLVNVCDKHNMVPELTKYLYDSQNQKYIDAFVQKRSPLRLPEVVEALLDVDAGEEYIKNLIMSIGSMCPAEALVDVVESRNRLRILQGWLEARVQEKNSEPAVHNALGKIYMDTNQNAEQFLTENAHYDSRVLGKYCENRDPNLAFIAYQRGQCDEELIAVTTKNCMFKQQARYLVGRQDPGLWATVLKEEDEVRKNLIDQVVNTVLPETSDTHEVSTTVKAFMAADLPHELTELLEKIVLHGSFKSNRYLQNLLLLTAIKAAQTKVMDYIQRLDNFDEEDIAQIASGAELHEEAFAIYKKANKHVLAITVLINDIKSLPRATEYAERVSEPECWSVLGYAQLQADLITEAVDSFVKANDASKSEELIAAAEKNESYSDLVRFLQMARQGGKAKGSVIDTELVYALAKTNRLGDLEEFVNSPNVAALLNTGNRLFDEGLYEAAKILFTSVGNSSRLAVCLCKLKEFYNAVDAAQKANTIKTWKEVNQACVDAGEFRLAQMCALHIIIQADELEEFVKFYEQRGLFDELISCLKAGLGHERAHMGMFTELGILYAKYRTEKLMEHIKLFHRRLNVHKLTRVCEQFHHWGEVRFLHTHNDEYDSAVKVMMEHPVEAWEHEVFKDCVTKVSNNELCYQALHHYIAVQPAHVGDLLSATTSRLDPQRVVSEVRRAGHLPLVKPYLESVQDANLPGVNEALNALYIEEEDWEALRLSVDQYDKFEQVTLAQQLEKHELIEFRRIAVSLNKRNGRWKHAIQLSQGDKLYKDAMETAAESQDKDLVDELLRFFVDQGLHECFAAGLYTCYELVRPDVALELAWRHNIMDFGMPYMIQLIKDFTDKVESLETKLEKVQANAAKGTGLGGHMDAGPALAIMGPPGVMPMPPMGMPMGFIPPMY